MDRTEAVRYLRSSINNISQLDMVAIMQFIYLKHQKTYSLDIIKATFDKHHVRGDLELYINNFKKSLCCHFNITIVHQNNNIIAYV